MDIDNDGNPDLVMEDFGLKSRQLKRQADTKWEKYFYTGDLT
jgi:hypothetical protein